MPETSEDYYRETRETADDNQVRSGTKFGNIIFVLTGGALLFCANLISDPDVRWSFFTAITACIAAIFFLAALMVHALSYIQSINYNRSVVNALDDWRRESFKGKFKLPQLKQHRWLPMPISYLAFILLAIGIVALGLCLGYSVLMSQQGKSADSVLKPAPVQVPQPVPASGSTQ